VHVHDPLIRKPEPTQVVRAIEVGLEALRSDPVRTRAALVAMATAMAIVVCLTTLVERGRAATIRSLERAGLKNLYLVQRHAPESDGLSRSRLTTADSERLAALMPVRAAVAIRMKSTTWAVGGVPVAAPLYAVDGPIADVFGMRARSGRLLAPLDVARKLPYAVVGIEVARTLARLPAAIASIVNVGQRSYQVVGVLEETTVESAATGEIPSLDWNRAVIVPLGTETEASDDPDARYPIDVAVLAFADVARADEAARLAGRLFAPGGTETRVRVASPIQTLRQYRQTRRTFDRIVWVVGLLTALSAVAGISNLLSASVIARAREIGLRRAVGARSSDIVLQFQAEGLLLGVLGGGAGLAAGLLLSVLTIDRSASGSSLSLAAFSGLALTCVAIGIATGIRPSLRASRIDPAQALREQL
jgi:ABC-type antimicrobial peptide transport system permease subunit